MDFNDWINNIYGPIYKDFKKRINNRLETGTRGMERRLQMRGKDFAFNDIFQSPFGIAIRTVLDRIDMPCISCGKPTKKRKNHTFSSSTLVDKFLSKRGHVYEFHLGTETEVIETDDQKWASLKGSFKKRGVNNVAIFHGFCSNCDHRIFINADSEDIINRKQEAIFQQLYRVLCSIYHETLRNTVIMKYILEIEESIGVSVGPHSILTQGRNPVTGDSINLHKMVQGLLYESYKHYNLVQSFNFDTVLERPEDFEKILTVGSIKVKKPSVIGSFLVLDKTRGSVELELNGIIRRVYATGIMGVVYPISMTETVCCMLGLPLGIDNTYRGSLYNQLFASYIDIGRERGDKAFFSKVLSENLIFGKNLLLSEDLIDSLSEDEKNTLCFAHCAKGIKTFPEVNLFF